MAIRTYIAAAVGLAVILSATGAGAFTREEGVALERGLDARELSASASRDGEELQPGTPLTRENGTLRLDSLTVVDREEGASLSGSISQQDTGSQRALNGDLKL